jgi:hypothetical protein
MQPWLHATVVAPEASRLGEWVLLVYRLPREPSTPRSAVWRRLRRLGVAQLGDGLVALPSDARTREQLDWVAAEVQEAGGTAVLWIACPSSRAEERQVMQAMMQARAEEYVNLRAEALASQSAPAAERRRALKRLRRQLREVRRRDFFPPPERDLAAAAVAQLAALAAEPDSPGSASSSAVARTGARNSMPGGSP